jgi:hypothetical protein
MSDVRAACAAVPCRARPELPPAGAQRYAPMNLGLRFSMNAA